MSLPSILSAVAVASSWKLLLSALLGASLGYGYFRVVGCRTGACLITSRWWTSTAYGALVGALMSR